MKKITITTLMTLAIVGIAHAVTTPFLRIFGT